MNPPIPPQRHTAEEIQQLARDAVQGRLFCSDQIKDPDDVASCFLTVALGLGDPKFVRRMKRERIVHVYEYMDKAGHWSVNGYPCFLSHRELNATDYSRFKEEADRMWKAIHNPGPPLTPENLPPPKPKRVRKPKTP